MNMQKGSVRIIGGEWRGRKLKVPAVANLRPTPDRVRETLFNWLSPVIADAYCLDLFTGTGALGFEALSRGAQYVEMVDHSQEVITVLQAEAKILEAKHAAIYRAVIPKGLHTPKQRFNIVFIDPPYKEDLLLQCCEYLTKHNFLAPKAYIYLEARETLADNDLPPHWRIIKSKKAGQVAYHLAQYQSNES